MLLKLLKYDFRAMWKQFSLIWGAALVLALVNRFTLNTGRRIPVMGENASSLLAIAFSVVLAAMFVIAVIFVIQRFARGLLGSEGYLMHTLPVRSWQLVAAKLICGTVTWIGCGMVAVLCPLIMAPVDWSEMIYLPWLNVIRGLIKHPDVILVFSEICLMIVSAIVISISLMYLAMSIGHLFSHHRKLVSVAAFIGLYILLANFYARIFLWNPVEQFIDWVSGNVHGAMLSVSAAMVIPALIFLALTSWILENKLNLE